MTRRLQDTLSFAQRLHRITTFSWLAIEAQKGVDVPAPLPAREAKTDRLAKSLRVLRSAVVMRADIERLATQAVEQARDAGASWQQIGVAMGTKASTVHRKYAEGATSPWDGLHGAAGERRIEEIAREIAASPAITQAFPDRHYMGPEIG